MDKFVKLTGVAAPLPVVNIDTDMIIPKDYLKTIKRTGLGKGLFAEARYNDVGEINPNALGNWLEEARTIQWDYKNIVKRRGRLERLT